MKLPSLEQLSEGMGELNHHREQQTSLVSPVMAAADSTTQGTDSYNYKWIVNVYLKPHSWPISQ